MSRLPKTVLIIDDDIIFCDAVREYLETGGIEVLVSNTIADGINTFSKRNIDVVLLDQNLPDGEGHALCPMILKYNEHAKIIFITAYPNFEHAVKAIRAGAYDYISKPVELEELNLSIENCIRTLDLEKVELLETYKEDKERCEVVLIGGQDGLKETTRLAQSAAETDSPVLITRETGTGKNVIAKLIHYRGQKHNAPFISINCAALPETLIEAELFGYEKGAYTGAVNARKGIFEMAEGGTLLLDEIAEMPMPLQSKLLGVIEEKTVRRIGGERFKPVNCRIMATTNIDLEEAVAGNQFRRDLFYRLNVIRISVPPLRDRRADIPKLCEYFIKKTAAGRGVVLDGSQINRLMEYDWPGNVRELQNILERSLLIQKGEVICPADLLVKPTTRGNECLVDYAAPAADGIATLKEIEKRHVSLVLGRQGGSLSKTARALGVSLNTLKKKIKAYNIAVHA